MQKKFSDIKICVYVHFNKYIEILMSFLIAKNTYIVLSASLCKLLQHVFCIFASANYASYLRWMACMWFFSILYISCHISFSMLVQFRIDTAFEQWISFVFTLLYLVWMVINLLLVFLNLKFYSFLSSKVSKILKQLHVFMSIKEN